MTGGIIRWSGRTVPQPRRSWAARWARRLASFSAMLFLVAGTAHRYAWLETVPFLVVLVLVGMLAGLALLLALAAFPRIWNFGDRGGADLAIGSIIALAVLAPFLIAGYRNLTHPALTDIATDLDDPPELAQAARLRTPDMNPLTRPSAEARRLQLEAYPMVSGRRYDVPIDRVADAVSRLVEARGWIAASPDPRAEPDAGITMEAVAHTPVLAFAVDVSIRIVQDDLTTFVDMRSASRYGRTDFGDNAVRIVGFLSDLDDAMAAQPETPPA